MCDISILHYSTILYRFLLKNTLFTSRIYEKLKTFLEESVKKKN